MTIASVSAKGLSGMVLVPVGLHAEAWNAATRAARSNAEHAIALEQFHEASWRLAFQADYALGLRESITRRYDELTKAFDEQLGLQPTREAWVMYRELLGQSQLTRHRFSKKSS